MSEAFGNPAATTPPSGPAVSASARTARGPAPEPAHEAYSFACLNCGYVWEQAYEIEHRVTPEGRISYEYRANGVRVPSPLTRPSCPGCGGDHVRIMRAGRVSDLDGFAHATRRPTRRHAAAEAAEEPSHQSPERPRPRHGRRLHLPFHFLLRRRQHPPQS